MYLCQTLYVFLTPSLLPSMSPITSIDLCLFPPSFHPMLLYFLPLPLSFLYCRWNSRFVLLWRRRGTEDGWEDGRQRDGERDRCSLGLVYLINYVLLLPLATLLLIFCLSCTNTSMVKHSLFILVYSCFPFYL